MKQKKQIRMTLVFLITVTVVVGWWLIKPSKLRAASQVSGRSQSSEIDSLTKMPLSGEKAATDWAYFGEGSGPFGAGSDSRWKNATAGEMIPAKYSFALSQMKDSENPENSTYIIDVSPGITQMARDLGYTDPYLVNPKGNPIYAAPARHPDKPDDDPASFAKVAVAFPTSKGEESWIKLANVGYYNGERLNVKVTVKPGQQVTNDRINWIGWRSYQFLECYFQKELGSLEVSFDFFTLSDSGNEKPIAITGNWPIYLRYPRTEVSVLSPTVGAIKNVYSVSPTAPSLPLLMTYRINEKSQLELSNANIPLDVDLSLGIQTCGILTFENMESISFRIIPMETFTGRILSVMYNFQPPVASEVPAPEAKEHVVPTISDFSQSDLYLEFNQFIPFEPVNFRNQPLKWKIAQQSVDTPVEYDSGTWENGWEVKNNQAVDSKNLFDFDFETGNGEITLKSNQYTALFQASNNYLFKQKMKLDYNKPIDFTLLRKVKEPENNDGYYLPRQAKATLSGRLVPPGTQENASTNYTTWINFESNVTYEFYDEHGVKKYSYDSKDLDYAADLTSIPLITHEAPLLSATKFESLNTTFKADNYAIAPTAPTYELAVADATVAANPPVGITHQLQCTDGNVVKYTLQPLYTVDVQVGAFDTYGKFGTIPFAPPSGTSAQYVTVQETTAPTTPEPENAISPTGTKPAAEFTFPTTYDFEVGTGKSYKVTQKENVNNDYTKPNQATSPVFSINDQNQLVVDGNVVNDLPYKDGDFILSWDAINKKLTIQIINFPNGDVEIEGVEIGGEYRVDDIDFGNITIPATSTITKAPEANNGTNKDQYPSLVVKDTRLQNYREAGWTLYVQMTKPFRLKTGENAFDENETIHDILKYKGNFDFIEDGENKGPRELYISEGEKIPIESLIPTDGETKVDLGAQKASKGFYLEIDKQTQLGITAGEYQAELTFSVENSAFTTPPTPPGRSK